MFGSHSATYIRENFTTLFDISEDEVDEGLLNIIAPRLSWMAEQLEEQANMANDNILRFNGRLLDIDMLGMDDDIPPPPIYEEIQAEAPVLVPVLTPAASGLSETADYPADLELSGQYADMSAISPANAQDVRISLVSVTDTSITVELFFNPIHHSANNLLRYYDFTIVNPPFSGNWVQAARPLPSGTSRFTINGLTPGAVYNLQASTWNASAGAWINADLTARTTGWSSPSLTYTSTERSFTVHAVFPSNGDHGNRLRYWNGWEWINIGGANHLSSGTFTVSNLTPGVRYTVVMHYINRMTNLPMQHTIDVHTLMPYPEVLRSFGASRVRFYLDQVIVDELGLARTNRFVAATNRAYDLLHGLVGGAAPFDGRQMELRNTRGLQWYEEGRADHPMLWQTYYANQFLYAIDHARAMSRFNTDTTESPIHEIGHNFDNSRWSFETEALAIFFTYYYYDMTNERMGVANQTQAWVGGSGYRTYMKSHANRIRGHINRDAAMSMPGGAVYSPYSLAYDLSTIQMTIGWEPFRRTFRAFHELPQNQVPTTRIDKLNLFLTLLSNNSAGYNVFAMIPSDTRPIYEAYFGGPLQRFEPGGSTQTFTVTYDANGGTGSVPDTGHYAAGATVTVRMGNLTRAGHTFAGWRRERPTGALDHVVTPDGTAVSPAGFTMPARNVRMYAAWDRVESGGIYTVHVQRERQRRTLWCWAAVVEMVTTYEAARTGNPNLIRTQEQIVIYTFGSEVNEAGRLFHVASALRMASRRVCMITCGTTCITPCIPECDPRRCTPVCDPVCERTFARADSYPLDMGSFNTVVVHEIRNERPVIVGCWPAAGIGHYYLIYEVRNTNIVLMIDPCYYNHATHLALSNRTLIEDGFFSPILGRHVTGQWVVNY